MESYMETHSASNSGLLRFRSAPSSVFNDYTHHNSWADSDKFSDRFAAAELPETYERKPPKLNSNNNSSSNNGYSSSQNGYPGQLPPQYPKQSNSGQMQRSNSFEIELSTRQGKIGSGLSLDRQSSLPSSGFFNHLSNNSNPQNGYAVMRGHLPQIPEFANANVKELNTTGFPFPCWKESKSDFPENGGLTGHPPLMLSHHLSLPKTSTEMAVIEKLVHFQDAVPCKVRAKRGCATHPRSIAERVRRNRISERMRKLQDLVPNMDKQTNTADMLDLAVDYIKNLQNEYKVLSDNRAKCKCPHLRH